jgi:phenylacetate-CoA ligase
MTVDAASRRRMEGLEREALQRYQLARFNELLDLILPHNTFYARKFAHVTRPVDSLEAFRELPFTTKEELVATDSPQGLAANMTWPMERYVRFHQTSGTHGRPLAVFDTAEDWQWWMDCWQYVLDSAGVTAADRAMLAFSFGPFIGFWSAHDALVARGALVIPGGGMNSRARLELLERTGATVLFCTPTYALHLVEVAEQCKFNLARSAVEKIVVAGEPGGSIPSIRQRIENAWQAQLIDHAGASEVGPWGYADAARRGLHVMESEFIAEFISVETGEPAASGELSHLVLTTLGRVGMPAIRYRTGDLVRPVWHEDALENGTGTHMPE